MYSVFRWIFTQVTNQTGVPEFVFTSYLTERKKV